MPRKGDTDNETTNSERLARIEALLVMIAETMADTHAFAVRAEEAAIRRRKRASLLRDRRAQSRRAKLGKKR
jgi:hypothetical protein